jgi:ferredoxin
MKITADLTKCLGYANCSAEAPEVYDLEGAYVKILQPEPGPELQDAARFGARQCPVRALTIKD